jgi:hypothetical protein
LRLRTTSSSSIDGAVQSGFGPRKELSEGSEDVGGAGARPGSPTGPSGSRSSAVGWPRRPKRRALRTAARGTDGEPCASPRRRPAQRKISIGKEHEAGTREFPGGRMSDGAANQFSSVRRIAQIPHQGCSVVDGPLSDVTKGLRSGGRHDQATRLGQGREANEAAKPGRGRRGDCSMDPIWTLILALLRRSERRSVGSSHDPGNRDGRLRAQRPVRADLVPGQRSVCWHDSGQAECTIETTIGVRPTTMPSVEGGAEQAPDPVGGRRRQEPQTSLAQPRPEGAPMGQPTDRHSNPEES